MDKNKNSKIGGNIESFQAKTFSQWFYTWVSMEKEHTNPTSVKKDQHVEFTKQSYLQLDDLSQFLQIGPVQYSLRMQTF